MKTETKPTTKVRITKIRRHQVAVEQAWSRFVDASGAATSRPAMRRLARQADALTGALAKLQLEVARLLDVGEA